MLGLGRIDESVGGYQKALAINPSNSGVFSNIQLSLQSMCYEVLKGRRSVSSVEEIMESLPSPPEPAILRLQVKSLTGGDVEEGWQDVVGHMPTIESETVRNDAAVVSSSGVLSARGYERKMVALFHFGRSGSGYLHS